MLYNRTIDAIETSPYGMIGLTRDSEGHTGLLIFYHPRVLTRAEGVAVMLKIDQRPPVQVKGDALSDFHVAITAPLEANVLDALRSAKTLEATTQGRTFRFELANVGGALDALATCVKPRAS